MSKLIYADSLRQDILALPNCYNGFSDTYDKACIIGVIDEQQPVDAVPVVRCKDCKHRYIENMTWHCPFGLMGGEDFFCGYGSLGRAERRSDEQ